MTKRSAWLDSRAYMFIRILKEKHGLWMTRERALADINEHLNRISSHRGISRTAARMYITKEFLEQTATALAAHAANQPQERPRHLTVLK